MNHIPHRNRAELRASRHRGARRSPKSVSSTRCLVALKWWLEQASRLLRPDARIVVLWRSAAAPLPPPNSLLFMTLHATSQSDFELRLPQERVLSTRCLAALKWWLEPASPPTTWCTYPWFCDGPLPRPRPLRTITPLHDSPRDLQR